MDISTQPERSPDVIIIGGGISGLSAAWHLEQAGQDLRYTVLESADHWGGFLQSERMEGPTGAHFIVDAGPESFITRKPEAWDLAQALGLGDRVSGSGSETRHMYILHRGRPVAVPLSPLAFLRSNLLSARGKARLMAEPFIPANTGGEDESLGDFVRRRLGQEALERFVGPILAGIYNTDPETQSILTTSPVMREMEREHGSLAKAAMTRMRERRRLLKTEPDLPPRFFTLKNGVQELVEALVSQLRGDLRLGKGARTILPNGIGYRVELDDGTWIQGRALILAAPANAAARLLAEIAPAASAALGRIRYGDIGTMSLAYREDEFRTRIRLNGLMVPRRERRAIDAVTWTSAKLPGRAPEGYSLLRVFFGGGRPEMVSLEPAKLLTVVRAELQDLLGFEGQPIDYRVFRWPDRFPQADVGHLDRLEQIEALLPESIILAGSAYRGIGVPDCIRQGRQAAELAVQTTQSMIQASRRMQPVMRRP